MESSPDRTAEAVPQTLERELGLIRSAIELVASGGSPRVVLAGLRFGEPLLGQARAMAASAGVRVVPLWTARSEGADLAVERFDASTTGTAGEGAGGDAR